MASSSSGRKRVCSRFEATDARWRSRPIESKTAEAIRAFSPADAAQYPDFCATLSRIGGFIGGLLDKTPPSLNGPAAGELWDLLKTGRRFRALGRTDGFRILRWMPMAVADLVAEWFSTDVLQAAVAARGIFGASQGPWSAGTGAVMLMNAATDPAPGGSSVMIKGGPGVLTAAMADAAREAGAEIRTGASVARVIVRDGRAAGVVLEDGSEIQAEAVVSNADPKRTLLDLLDPVELDPGFLTKVRNYRVRGTAAKINLALSACRHFVGVDGTDALGRTHSHRADDRLPGTGVRCVEVRRDLAVIPTSTSPSHRCTIRRWRPRART